MKKVLLVILSIFLFAFSLGAGNGEIIGINYQPARYLDVSANEAAQLINNEHPLILRCPHAR